MITRARVGRLELAESPVRNLSEKPSSALSRTVSIEGVQNGHGEKGIRAVRRMHQDIVGSYGAFVPVTFEAKPEWNGYYYVNNPQVTLTDWSDEGVAQTDWKIDLELAGYANDIDIESRLGGPLTLANEFTATGERWHAPPIGHRAYWSSSVPSQQLRTTTDGQIMVYRDVPVNVNPRWSCDPLEYGLGRVRFIDIDGFERTGLQSMLDPIGWTLHNGIVSVGVGDSTALKVGLYRNGTWQVKQWRVEFNDADLGSPDSITITRNDYEIVQLRLLWDMAPSGRVTADLTLRRGARYFEIYVKSMVAGEIGVRPAVGEASANNSGYITASGNDAAGNRYVAGSPAAYTADTGAGGLSKASVTALDAFIGIVQGGATDNAAMMYEHFLGAPTERVIGVRL